ncbi:hypothetical protein S820908_042 [Synechococcus phage S-CAM9]|uniref:Uncharacterized protein n=1 Tax=Synechococcus phage S-CAM9 TaxID=1883369 RepID=A0A1D8KPD6_9CAUD|nr:2OG-Fe(II) oxygenase [Synechococcus phage S-CAM9]AOV60189.1 hypothetical protein S050808_042 [Synechococcus phage S-CAM9]AOV60417.1 hypothetical protein S820908_042 [Synechococcus phage S-CAM9]AOV60645.1 hypothetical protein N161109_042 [Synechococcus phage S-CAM9]
MKVIDTICFSTVISVFKDFLSEEENDLVCSEIISANVDGNGSRKWLSGENSPDNSFGTNFCRQNQVLRKLAEKVTRHITSYQRDVYKSTHEIKLRECWYNRYTGYQYQEMHQHLPSLLSCVYYAKLPEGSKGLTFTNPFVKSEYPKTNLKASHTMDNFTLEVKERDVIVFPSHVPHMVPAGVNKEPRMTVSFNFE